jgi:hypothetical protein
MAQLLVVPAPPSPRPDLLYLLVAAVCLLSALYFLRVTVAPAAALARATVAALLVALSISVALVVLTLAALVR